MHAPSFDSAHLTQDLSKPIVATEAMMVGDVIYSEDPVAKTRGRQNSSLLRHNDECNSEVFCRGCCTRPVSLTRDAISAVGPYAATHVQVLVERCQALMEWDDLFKPKNLLKCLRLLFRGKSLESQALATYLSHRSGPLGTTPQSDTAAKTLRLEHPQLIPSFIIEEQVSRLIVMMDNHKYGLNGWGEGVYLETPVIPHSCDPNASITDDGDRKFLTAIRSIDVGQAITVDRVRASYTPLSRRADQFVRCGVASCGCGVCTGVAPDKSRAFKCKTSGCQGLVHPTNGAGFGCSTCAVTWDASTVAAVESDERGLAARVARPWELSPRAAVKIMALSSLHRFHHLWFDLFIGMRNNDQLKWMPAFAMDQLDALDYVCPHPNENHKYILRKLSDYHVERGNVDQAREAYTRAYEVCLGMHGADGIYTRHYERLMHNTPTSKKAYLQVIGGSENYLYSDDEEFDDVDSDDASDSSW